MRLLFLGYAVSGIEANRLEGASIAGNRMQLGIINALTDQPNGVILDAVTVWPIAPFHQSATLCVREGVIDLGDLKSAKRVGFLNLPVLKQLIQILAVMRTGTRLARVHEYDYVFAYNMFPQVGVPAWLIGRLFRIPVVCLLADPPIDHLPSRRGISKAVMHAYFALTTRLLRTCAGVIVLNQCAAERYAPQAARLLMDGAVDVDSAPGVIQRVQGGPKRVVFTGSLVEYNGIMELIEAMRLVRSEDVVLDLYGIGPLAEFARRAARTEPKINYHGRVSSDAIPGIQQEAFLLINPRRVDDPMSEVTFPSKILEYMLSGTPVLSTKLNGLTEEYEGKMFFMSHGTAEEIAHAIDDLVRRAPDELRDTAQRAREFVVEERSWAARGSLMRRFLSSGMS